MRMNAVNPFSDPEFKKQLLEKEGKAATSSGDDYEILQPEEDISKDLRGIIAGAPKIPKQVSNIIMDASAIASNQKEQKALELTNKLNQVFTRYNKEYGIDLHVDFSSLSNTLVNVADPKSRHILELYVSEVFQSIRPILILNMISKLCLCIDYILDPVRLFDSSQFTLQDSFIAVEKIMQFIDQLEQMKDSIVVKGSDLELKKIAEETGNQELASPEAQKTVQEFLKLFQKEQGID